MGNGLTLVWNKRGFPVETHIGRKFEKWPREMIKPLKILNTAKNCRFGSQRYQ